MKWKISTLAGLLVLGVSLVLVIAYISLYQPISSQPRTTNPANYGPQQHVQKWKLAARHVDKDLKVFNLSSPVPLDVECIKLKTNPPTPICIYSKGDFLSENYKRGIWEPKVLNILQKALRKDPDLGFIDIGANLGYYSLIVANMGHKVVAVEPLPSNIWRLQKAAMLAGTRTRLTVVQNALSDRHGVVPIHVQKGNIGLSSLTARRIKPCLNLACHAVQTVYLDDILPLMNFSKALMKIDAEGFEPRIFLRAAKVFDAVTIPFITMEWEWHRRTCTGVKTREQALVDKMFRFFKTRKYEAYTPGDRKPLFRQNCSHWPLDVLWVRNDV